MISLLEKEQAIPVGRIGEGQGQLHLPIHGTRLGQPTDTLTITVGADLNPTGPLGIYVLIDIEAAEGWLQHP
ncbi:hypothetical protein D3C71_1905550 [compost metagenome]